MSQPRIFIAVACHNRRNVAELCLPTLRDSVHPDDSLILYNDGSSEYDDVWLRQFGTGCVVGGRSPVGIQAQRREHLRHFLFSKDATHLYLTDHDCIHDPEWRSNALRLQNKYGGFPTCLYDTKAHSSLKGNTLLDDPASEVIWRAVAPGVSYLLTRDHVNHIVPHIDEIEHFDWQIPALLGNRFAVSRVGYIDHIGWGGERHPAGAGLDEGDRVNMPTKWLAEKRAEVIAKLRRVD